MINCNKIEILSEELISNEPVEKKQLKILFSHLIQCDSCLDNFSSAYAITSELADTERVNPGFIDSTAPKISQKWYKKTVFHASVAIFAIVLSSVFALHIYTFNESNNRNRVQMLTRITEALISKQKTDKTTTSTLYQTKNYFEKISYFDTTVQEIKLNNITKEKFNNEKSVFDDYSYSSYF